jgi:hypothetical protein
MMSQVLEEDADVQEWREWQEFLARGNPMPRRWRTATAIAALVVTGVITFLVVGAVSAPAPSSDAPAGFGGRPTGGQQQFGVPLFGRGG